MDGFGKLEGSYLLVQFGKPEGEHFTPEVVTVIQALYDLIDVSKLDCVPNPHYVCTKKDGFCYFSTFEVIDFASCDVCPCEHDCPYALSVPLCDAPSDAHCPFFLDVPIKNIPKQFVGWLYLLDEHDI